MGKHYGYAWSYGPAVGLAIGLLAAFAAVGDTTIMSNEFWSIDGTTDTGPDPVDIAVTVDGTSVGPFSELNVFHSTASNGFVQVYSILGNGTVRPSLPPSGEFGASFHTTGYWDCEQGLIADTAIVALKMRSKAGKAGSLQLSGRLSNFNSMEAKDLSLLFFPPTDNASRVEVQYLLVATRNFCVDQAAFDTQQNFRLMRMASNFIDGDVHGSDQARFKKVTDKTCVLGHCNISRVSVCVALQNQDGLILDDPKRLGDTAISLVHTNDLPAAAPTVTIHFRAPARGRIKPQGSTFVSADSAEENVSFWGNWLNAKQSYRAGQKVCRIRCVLETVPPGPHNCDNNLP